MENPSILGNKNDIICDFLLIYSQVVTLGLELSFMVLFFIVRVRVSVMVIIVWHANVLYEKSHSFTSLLLSNLIVRHGHDLYQ